MTRRDVMMLFYNSITSTSQGNALLNTFGYNYYEDALFIASSNEDSSIPVNKILTSEGQFEVDSSFDDSKVGYKGDMVVKNSGAVVAFVPKNIKSGEYTLNAIIEDDVLVYSGNETKTLDVGDNTDVYYKSEKTTLSGASQKASLGDLVSVFKNTKGDIEYIMIGNGKMKGPYVVRNSLSFYGIPDDAKVYLNGEKASVSGIETNDVVYYSKSVNTVWAYRKKVIGVYEKALPNKDNPTTVNLSGTEYSFETADIYKEFATGGSFNLGDTVTVLLGKNGKIAGVVTAGANSTTSFIGYVTKVGTKEFEKPNGDKYTSNYAGLVQADGTYTELATKRLYDTYNSSIVKSTIADGVASLSLLTKTPITGKFDASNNMLGTTKVSPSCEFIDVINTEPNDAAGYIKVYKSRLDGVNFTSKSVLYYTKNRSGEIDSMFLNNVTKDGLKYGVVTSAKGSSYTLKCGTESYTSSGSVYTSIDENSVVSADVSSGRADKLKLLSKISKKIKYIDQYTVETSDATYKVSENCAVYKNDNSGNWQLCTFSDIENATNITVYYDTETASGGRVRVILIK